MIVQSGTLRLADAVVAGAAWGRVKALLDETGDNVKEGRSLPLPSRCWASAASPPLGTSSG